MKSAQKIDLKKLSHIFKVAVREQDRVNCLLRFTGGRAEAIEALNQYEAGELMDDLLKTVKMANVGQIQKLQILYRDLKLVEQKKEILLNYTHNRTDSTAGLTFDEARDLIQDLATHEPNERMRKMVFSFAYRAGIIWGESDTDKKINRAKLNIFLRERGTVKKDIEKQTLEELKKSLAQFSAMVGNNQKTKDNKEAKKMTNELLTKLNLTVK